MEPVTTLGQALLGQTGTIIFLAPGISPLTVKITMLGASWFRAAPVDHGFGDVIVPYSAVAYFRLPGPHDK